MYFTDWTLCGDNEVIANQYDNLSRSLLVQGDLPDGWEWEMLVEASGNLDIIPLELMENGVGALLTDEMLALSGNYVMQLRGTVGEVVRHTNKINAYIPASLSGDAHWPEIPSAFTEFEDQIKGYVAEAEEAADRAAEVIPPGGDTGQVLGKLSPADRDVGWVTPSGSGTYQIGDGLKLENGVLSVDTVNEVLEDNTQPVTSGAVFMELGNVEVLLANI